MRFEKDIELFDLISILYKNKKSVFISFIFFVFLPYIADSYFNKIEIDNNIISLIENENSNKLKEEMDLFTENNERETARLNLNIEYLETRFEIHKKQLLPLNVVKFNARYKDYDYNKTTKELNAIDIKKRKIVKNKIIEIRDKTSFKFYKFNTYKIYSITKNYHNIEENQIKLNILNLELERLNLKSNRKKEDTETLKKIVSNRIALNLVETERYYNNIKFLFKQFTNNYKNFYLSNKKTANTYIYKIGKAKDELKFHQLNLKKNLATIHNNYKNKLKQDKEHYYNDLQNKSNIITGIVVFAGFIFFVLSLFPILIKSTSAKKN